MENAKFDCGRKITIFKTFNNISKIVHLPLVTNVPMEITNKLNKMQKRTNLEWKQPKN